METTEKNLEVIRQGQDFYAMNDPQPVGLVQRRTAKGRWVWRCHIDVSEADLRVGIPEAICGEVRRRDFHLADYAKEMGDPAVHRPSGDRPSHAQEHGAS